jgi:ComF family protein
MYEGVGRTLVERLKFERTFSAAHVIAQSITNQFPFQLHNSAVLVPVPTATSRVRHRGFDQSLLITKALAKKNKTQYKCLLLRLGQQRQTGSERKQRLVQLEGAFEVRVRALRGVRQVILVDDVLTTGSTLEVAARMLKEAGVKRVSAIVFARAINDK